MSERRLKVFQAVARSGSFSLAARQLGMTQPAVSFQVRQLEDTLGCRLIDRSTRTLHLTPEGQLALQYADRIIALGDEMKCEVKALAGSSSASLPEA